jgi:hypothetical protein
MLTDEQAIADYQSGFADLAGIYTSHAATELTLQQKGLIGILQAPTTNVGFMMPNLEINIPGLKTIDPYSTNIKADTFANNGLRAFLAASFPYATVQNTLNTVDGLNFFFTYAGYFPEYLGNIYPTNNPAVLAGTLDINASIKAARFVRFCDVPELQHDNEYVHRPVVERGAEVLRGLVVEPTHHAGLAGLRPRVRCGWLQRIEPARLPADR